MRSKMYLAPLVVVAVAALCQGTWALSKTSCNCGWVNKGRIVGGQETKKNEYPWMAALYIPRSRIVGCGASIITPNHALTAGHCNTGDPYVLLVGLHDSRRPETGKQVQIERMISHPDYDRRAPTSDDIAVIVTRTAIPLSQNVGPVCLPTGRIPLDGQKIRAIGWGMTAWGKPSSPVLRAADLSVVSYETCRKSWTLSTPQSQICTLDNGKSTCHGDSGGPLVWLDRDTNRYTLVALTSFGNKCQTPPPAVNTEVGAYIQWIKNTVAATKPGSVCTKV